MKLLEATPFADEEPTRDISPVVRAVAKDIFDLLEQSKQIAKLLKTKKRRIAPEVLEGPIRIDGEGTIFYVEGGTAKVANKEKIREMLIKVLKVSPEVAQQIVNGGSTEKTMRSYIRVQPETGSSI